MFLEWKNVAGGILFVHGLSGGAFGHHVSHDSQHGSTSVVELDIEFADLVLGVGDVITEPANTVVSIILGGGHPGTFDKGEEDEDLEKSRNGDGTDPVHTGGHVGELDVLGLGEVSIKDNVVVVNNVSNDGSHANTSVLALHGTTTFEGLWGGVEPPERIKHTQRRSGSKLQLVHHVHSRRGRLGGLLGGGSKGTGRCGKESGDKELHGLLTL
mmetsp:Transcript_78/g.175  ORF Transcript_78/g.175 Transcript_78/m.175 type:complete len:213 (-) Transcript_78:77-715(-)